jgi:glycerophosphoryl diester phosphodiesterase
LRNIILTLLPLLLFVFPDASTAQLVVAHRGASHDAPENTLAAFRLAWEKHADAIEGDFYVTKDSRIVCIHDKTTKRVSPKQRELTVAKSTLDELRKLDIGSWKHDRYSAERIPTLKQVLATVPEGKQIFVEIKCGPEILPLLKPQLAASGLEPEQIVIICFNQAVITQSRRMMPAYNANWLTGYKQQDEQSQWKPTRDDVIKILKRTGATGLGTNGNLSVIDQAFVDAVHDAGREFHVWTVNDVDDARRFADFGAFSITTDRPALIRNAIQQKPAAVR